MLKVMGVTKKYGNFTAIENVALAFDKGAIYGLIGYNGAGKTTLLKTLCGVFKPDQGTIELDGQPVFDNPNAKARLFYVPDNPYVPPHSSMLYMQKFYRAYYPKWNENLFGSLTSIFKLDVNKSLSSFSKGMFRQAYIIFALCVSADYLLLDESFDGIDPLMREMTRRIITKAAESGVGVILSSHNVPELSDLCAHVSILKDKRISGSLDLNALRADKTLPREQIERIFEKEAQSYDISGLFGTPNGPQEER